MSDTDGASSVQIVGMVLTFLGTVFTGVMAYLMQKLNRGQKEASVKQDVAVAKTEEVKQTLDANTEIRTTQMADLKQVTKDTHTLVNSNMGVQLQLHADTAKRLASVTGDPSDKAAAAEAARLYAEHMAKQAVVDADL